MWDELIAEEKRLRKNAIQRAWKRTIKNPELYREMNKRSAAKQRAANPTKYNLQRWSIRAKHPERYLLEHARQRALKLDVEFNLELSDIIIPEGCPVLGLKLEWGFGQRASANKASPSLDRMDPLKGYVKGNVFVISNRANHLKNNGTLEEFECLVAYLRGR